MIGFEWLLFFILLAFGVLHLSKNITPNGWKYDPDKKVCVPGGPLTKEQCQKLSLPNKYYCDPNTKGCITVGSLHPQYAKAVADSSVCERACPYWGYSDDAKTCVSGIGSQTYADCINNAPRYKCDYNTKTCSPVLPSDTFNYPTAIKTYDACNKICNAF